MSDKNIFLKEAGWLWGQQEKTKKKGMFPANFTRKVPPPPEEEEEGNPEDKGKDSGDDDDKKSIKSGEGTVKSSTAKI